MVDVPRHLEPSDAERLHTYLARMTPGGAGGDTRAVGPILSRDVVQARVVGGGDGDDGLDSRSSQIDQFSVTGTATSTFQLTFSPLDSSWNVSLGHPLDNGVDYTISGQTLTILSPSTLFNGAATQGSPWTLQVQYDYLTGVPTSPNEDATFPQSVGFGEQTTTSPTISFAAAPTTGSSVLLLYKPKFGGACASITGMGATWTRVGQHGSTEMWLGAGCSGGGVMATLSSDHVFSLQIVEISTPLKATGSQAATGDGLHFATVTASGNGVAYAFYSGGVFQVLTPATAGWTQLPVAGTQGHTAWVRATANAEVNRIDSNGINAFTAAGVGVVKYA